MEQLIKGVDYYRLELELELDRRLGHSHFDAFCETDSDSDLALSTMAETFV